MIAYVKGILVEIEDTYVVVEAGNIGYSIFIPAQPASGAIRIGQEIKLHTYFHVKEDLMQLYGFFFKDDLQIFKLLINVNGIGPKGALGVLSALTADDLRFAVLSDDVKKISGAPGIGKKTAQKLILELKDKLSLEDSFEKKLVHQQSLSEDVTMNSRKEAVLALTALGYSNSEAAAAVNKVEIASDTTVEMILKEALKYLTVL